MSSAKLWCFNSVTEPLSKLSTAEEAFKAELENVHAQVDAAEWERIVGPMNLKDHESVEGFQTRPASAASGPWWDLSDPDCWASAKEITSNYDVSEELAEFEAITNTYVSTIGTGGTTLSANYINEILIPFFGRATTALPAQTFAKIDKAIYQIYDSQADISEVDAGLDTWFGAAIKILVRIQKKVENIPCQDTRYFKQLYEAAVLKLAQPEIDKKREELEAAREAYKDAKSADRSSGGKAADAAEFVSGITTEIDKLYEKAKNNIGKAIGEEVEEELEEAFADNLVFSQQCFLMSYMDELIDKKVELDKRFATEEHTSGLLDLPYFRKPTNAPIRMMGEPFGFLNKLAVDSSQAAFFDIDNKTLSSLIPHIRLFKVEAGKDGKDVETEITFDANGYDSIFSEEIPSKEAFRKQRGHGVGMRSFNFSYDGTDPFSAKKMIAAKLSLYASTFDELLRERTDPNGKMYKYAELALKTGGISGKKKEALPETERKNLEKLNFRLKATLGWTADNSVLRKLSDESKIKKAIYNSYITIYLTPTIHNFSFDETGAVTFDIEYLAYIEDAFSQSTYNIFAELAKEKKARELIFNYFEEMGCDPKHKDDFKKFRDQDEKLISDINQQAFSKIAGKLHEKDKIYYLSFDKQDTEKLLANPTDTTVKFPEVLTATSPTDTTSQLVDAAKKAESGDDDDTAVLSAVAVSQDNNNVPFFYFNDLVSVVMETIEEQLKFSSSNPKEAIYYKQILALDVISKFDAKKIKSIDAEVERQDKNKLEQFRKMRVILGPMEMFNPIRTNKTILCSLGEIPISLSYFLEFMSERVTAKEILSYPFAKFIKDLINDLITNFLNSDSCTRVDNSQRLKLNSTTISAYNRNRHGSMAIRGQQIDDITAQISGIMRRTSPILLLGGTRDTPKEFLTSDRMTNYFVFTIGRKSPISSYLGNKSEDEANGIFHYIIGKDKGFVKNITLEKTTANGLKEVRFEQEGYNGLEQLREVYNSTIETFLNVQTFPGVYVYVDPDGFAPNANVDLTRYGIGGYSMVIKTEHTISPGVADTTLHTVWVASKEGNPEKSTVDIDGKKQRVRTPDGAGDTVKKCLVGPHDIGLMMTRRGKYRGLSDEEAGRLGSEVVASGVYTV